MNPTPYEEARLQTIAFLEQQRCRGKRSFRMGKGCLEGGDGLSKGGDMGAETRGEQISISRSFSEVLNLEAPRKSLKLPMTSEQRRKFEELRKRALACQNCAHLVKSRKQVVFGVGNLDAELMFVGEAPGADEDAQGEPFVGRAGQLLTKMIQAMGLQRSDVYIANILKCRPDIQSKSGNRKPTPEEMETCVPYLKEQIALIRPRVLVAVGDTAVKGLLPDLKTSITRIRGTWLEFEHIPMMPTFHPSYLLHNQSLALKRQCWEDLLKVMERLEIPISEKQRNYFLTALNSEGAAS